MSAPTAAQAGIYERLQQAIDQRDSAAGLAAADLLDLPLDLRRVLQFVIRVYPVGAAEVGAAAGLAEEDALAAMEALLAKGLVARADLPGGRPGFRPHLARRRPSQLPAGLWDVLTSKIDAGEDADG